jgi:hypothetical protein
MDLLTSDDRFVATPLVDGSPLPVVFHDGLVFVARARARNVAGCLASLGVRLFEIGSPGMNTPTQRTYE